MVIIITTIVHQRKGIISYCNKNLDVSYDNGTRKTCIHSNVDSIIQFPSYKKQNATVKQLSSILKN